MKTFFQTCGSPIRTLHLASMEAVEENTKRMQHLQPHGHVRHSRLRFQNDSPPSTWERGHYTSLCALNDTTHVAKKPRERHNHKGIELKQINLSKLELVDSTSDADDDDDDEEEEEDLDDHEFEEHEGSFRRVVHKPQPQPQLLHREHEQEEEEPNEDQLENVRTTVTRKSRGNGQKLRRLQMDKVHHDVLTLLPPPVILSNWIHTLPREDDLQEPRELKDRRTWARKQMDKLFSLEKFYSRKDEEHQATQKRQQDRHRRHNPEQLHRRQPQQLQQPAAERTLERHSVRKSQRHTLSVTAIAFHDIKLGTVIGTGAFGKVYRGIWKKQQVAVKVLLCQRFTSEVRSEFEAEMEIMSLLCHPNICKLVGACLMPPNRALVMEYLPLGSLWGVLRMQKQLLISREMRSGFALDTAKGMKYLHRFGTPILHRDLKSPNLLVDKNFRIKISDFGLARVKAHVKTMTGNCGTVQWMAPEVLANKKYTEKADVYSFGIVLWEIFSAQCPYDGMSQIQAAMAVLNHRLRPQVPSLWPFLYRSLMIKCWDHNPDKRPSFECIVQVLQTGNVNSLMDA